jgi:hypothetical protein
VAELSKFAEGQLGARDVVGVIQRDARASRG